MDSPAADIAGSGSLDSAAGGALRPDQASKASQQAARQSTTTDLPNVGHPVLLPQALYPAGSGLASQALNVSAKDGSVPLTSAPLLQLASVPPGSTSASNGGNNGRLLLGTPTASATSLADAALKLSARSFPQFSGMVPVEIPEVSRPVQAIPRLVPVALAPVASAPAAPSVAEEQIRVLEGLLDHIGRTDSDKFFEAPVREEEAPGYSSIIKRPMCFQVMRQKVRQRAYRTWQGFVEDFELIANNAMTYNQKRSRVHKAAITMLRAGKKHLQNLELQGRKGISLLHPGGPQAAAADEAAERSQHHHQHQQQLQMTQAAQQAPLVTPTGPAMLSAQPRISHAGSSGTLHRSSAHSPTAQMAMQAQGQGFGSGSLRDAPYLQDPFYHLLPIDCQTEDEAGFSSFSDTDWDSEAAPRQHPRLPPSKPSSVPGSLPLAAPRSLAIPTGAEVLAKAPQLCPPVTRQTWAQLLGQACPPGDSNVPARELAPAAHAAPRRSAAHAPQAPSFRACFPESLDIIAAAAAAAGWPPALHPSNPMQVDDPGASQAANTAAAAPASATAAAAGRPPHPPVDAEDAACAPCKQVEGLVPDPGAPTEGDEDDDEGALPSSANPGAAQHAQPEQQQKPSKVRQLEWQVGWLQLRVKELSWQQHRATQQLTALEASPVRSGPSQPAAALDAATVSSAPAGPPAADATVVQPSPAPVSLEDMVAPPAHELKPPPAPPSALSSRPPQHAAGHPVLAHPTGPPSASTTALAEHPSPMHHQLSSTQQGSVRKHTHRSKPRRRRAPLRSMLALQAHPFFAARAGHTLRPHQGSVGQAAASLPPPGMDTAAWVVDASAPAALEVGEEERLLLPACVHWGLEQLEKHVAASKRLLLQTQVGQASSQTRTEAG